MPETEKAESEKEDKVCQERNRDATGGLFVGQAVAHAEEDDMDAGKHERVSAKRDRSIGIAHHSGAEDGGEAGVERQDQRGINNKERVGENEYMPGRQDV